MIADEKIKNSSELELAFENISMKDRNNTAPYQEKLKELTKEIEKQISNRE